jgi:hypothetical protein
LGWQCGPEMVISVDPKGKINMVLVKNGLIESRLCVVKWPWSNGQQMVEVRRLADEVLAHREMPVE